MELSESLILIRDFLSPASKLDQAGLNEITLSSILSNIIDNFSAKHSAYINNLKIENENDPIWKFGFISLNLIKDLNNSKFELNQQNCYLSLNDERLISSFCQLITCFCIHYNLEDNNGISIEKLSKYGVNLTKKRNEIDSATRNKRMIITLNCLYEIKQNKREHIDLIKTYFYRKYIHDLICALIQVSYSPNSCLQEIEKEKFKNWLEVDLFEEADGANIVSNLIMAQGTGKTKTNEWFTNIIGKLLTKSLLRPNSVMNVIRAVLTEMNAVSTVTVASDWKKCDVVARILAQCPKNIQAEDYIKFISPQILNLFFSYDQRFAKHFYRVSGSVYSLFAQRWPALTRQYITKSILQDSLPNFDSLIEFKQNSKQFRENLNKLHLVYVSSTEPNWNTLNQLPIELIYLLFKIYVIIFSKVNSKQTKSLIEDILKLYIRMMPQSLKFLTSLLKDTLLNSGRLKLNFETYDDECDEDTILIEYPNELINTIEIEMVEKHCKGFLNLIEAINDVQLKIDFMILLFSEINNCVLNESQPKHEASNDSTDKTLLNLEEKMINLNSDINIKIIYFTELSLLFESIDPELIVKNHTKIIEFCKLILENFLKLLKELNSDGIDIENNETDKNNYEIIHLVLSVISVFTTGVIELDYEVKKSLQVLLPIILEIKNFYFGTELANMSDALYVSIATYLGVKYEKEIKKEKILIEEIEEPSEEYSLDDYGRALRDANDPLIPIKAHGLVHLRRLVDLKNEKCVQNNSKLIDLSIRHLKNEDSYVYLAAINLLISLVNFEPNKVLDILIEQYLSNKNKLDVENRLKVGEVLTKTIRNFNELVPKYGPKLINTFLVGCKNSDEMIRSSSLSNLGETCKLLNYSITENIYEIMNCLSSLIETDSSIEVKRSASMVLKMIVEGLRKDTFVQVLGSSIAPLYKMLVHIKTVTNDDIIKLNCQLTSDYINELMKHSMFPKQTLQKEIKVLRP